LSRCSVSRCRGSVDDSCLSRSRKIQKASETFHVVVHLNELIVQSRVRNRCDMKNCIKSSRCRIAELFPPIQCGQIFRDKIPAIPGQILEITRSKIVNDREPRAGEFFLQCECEIRTNEPGAARDNEVWSWLCHEQVVLFPSRAIVERLY